MAVIVVCSMITNCSVLTGVMDKSFSSSSRQKVSVIIVTTEDTHHRWSKKFVFVFFCLIHLFVVEIYY